MKIFVSYSRSDASDFAEQIRKYLTKFNHKVFTDTSSIGVGDIWNSTIEDNISSCDIFVAIITHGSLISPNVDKEVLQAQREKKRIIPCMHRDIEVPGIEHTDKWGLEKIQGIMFNNEFNLARDLYSRIERLKSDQIQVEDNQKVIPEKSEELEQPLPSLTPISSSNEQNAVLPHISRPPETKKQHQQQHPLFGNPKVLIPIIVVIAAAVIVLVVFGTGIMHHQQPPPTSSCTTSECLQSTTSSSSPTTSPTQNPQTTTSSPP
jgi:TIR domain